MKRIAAVLALASPVALAQIQPYDYTPRDYQVVQPRPMQQPQQIIQGAPLNQPATPPVRIDPDRYMPPPQPQRAVRCTSQLDQLSNQLRTVCH